MGLSAVLTSSVGQRYILVLLALVTVFSTFTGHARMQGDGISPPPRGPENDTSTEDSEEDDDGSTRQSQPFTRTSAPNLALCLDRHRRMSTDQRFCMLQSALKRAAANTGNYRDNEPEMNAVHIGNSIDDVEEIIEMFSEEELTEEFVYVAADLLSYVLEVAEAADFTLRPANRNRILRLLPSLFEGSSLGMFFNLTTVMANFAVTLEEIVVGDFYPGATFLIPDSSSSAVPQLIGRQESVGSLRKEQLQAAIVLPTNITAFSLESLQNVASNLVIQFSVIPRTSVFEVNETDSFGVLNFSLASDIITSQVGNWSVTGLHEPVTIVLKEKINGSNATCVFWSYDTNDGYGGWLTDGCWLNSSENDIHICQCNHLTSFALLLSLRGDDISISNVQRQTAVIGLSISSALLLLTLLILAGIKSLRREMANKLVIHFCLMLLLLNILSIINYELTPAKTSCIVITSIMQYSVLSLYLWTLAHGVYLYRNIVAVFKREISHVHAKCVAFCYGLPLVVCFVTMAARSFSMTAYYPSAGSRPPVCHLQVLYDGLISLYIPISAVALVNIVIFISVFRLAFKQRKRQSSKRQGRFRILRVAMATFILLGLSWIFGLVGLAFQQEAIDIIFTTLLAASGMLVFVVKVLLAEQVRNAVGRLLNRGVVGDSLDMPYENRRLSLTSLLNRSFNSSASSLHRHSHNSHEADCSVSSSLPSSQETPFSMAHPSRSTTTPSASNVIGISLCSITEDLPTSE